MTIQVKFKDKKSKRVSQINDTPLYQYDERIINENNDEINNNLMFE